MKYSELILQYQLYKQGLCPCPSRARGERDSRFDIDVASKTAGCRGATPATTANQGQSGEQLEEKSQRFVH